MSTKFVAMRLMAVVNNCTQSDKIGVYADVKDCVLALKEKLNSFDKSEDSYKVSDEWEDAMIKSIELDGFRVTRFTRGDHLIYVKFYILSNSSEIDLDDFK